MGDGEERKKIGLLCPDEIGVIYRHNNNDTDSIDFGGVGGGRNSTELPRDPDSSQAGISTREARFSSFLCFCNCMLYIPIWNVPRAKFRALIRLSRHKPAGTE